MKALDFVPCEVHNNLLLRGKLCTIRLGDKSADYAQDEMVWITYGHKFSLRKKLYSAVIDKVLVKPINQLTEKERNGENFSIRNSDDMCEFFKTVYQKEVINTDVVTVVYFSEVVSD